MNGLRSRLVRKYLPISLISACVLALQVVFTRVFSIMIWHHFTYLVIGVALLGGGAAGTLLAILRWDKEAISHRIGIIALGFSSSIFLDVIVIYNVQFDPLRSAEIIRTLVGLSIYFTALFMTYFLGSLTIISAFSLWVEEVHRLYFADLLGAGLSMVFIAGLIHLFGGPSCILIISLFALLAGWLFGIKSSFLRRFALPI